MAVKKVYVDLDGGFVNTLLNWRITNLTTAQRNQLATQLGSVNIGLPVFDTTTNSLFIWGGSAWLPVGGGNIPVVPGGNNGDVQFNNEGTFDGTDQFVWNTTNNNLLIGTNTDNETARIQILDGTSQNQLALHYDNDNYAVFLVDNIGDLTVAVTGGGGGVLINQYLYAGGGIYIAEGTFLSWGTASSFITPITSLVDGNLSLFDSTLTNFNLLQFGGLTASYPALKRNGTNLEVKLSDDSAYSNLALSKLLMQSSVLGSPVNGTLETDYTNLYFTLGGIRKEVSFGTFDFELSTTGTTGAATYIGTQLNIPIYQGELTLTTTGSTGISTLIGNVLNIPDYTAPSGYTLPPATYTSLGGVIVGSNLSVNNTGLLNLFASGVTSALGYIPYNSTNPSNYISLTALSAILPIFYNNTTGVFTIANATTSSYGVVEVGANIGVSNGIISLQSSGITGALGYTPLDPSGTSAQYFAGNGQLFTFPTLPTPGGSNTDIQYNNSGAFGGTNAFTWSGLLLYVSGNTQITSLGSTGTTMVVASSTGLLSTQSLPTTTSPGGSNTDIQFNNLGAFSGSNNFTWNGALLFVSGNTQIGSLASTGTTMVVATSTGLLQTQTIPVSAISSVSNNDGTLTISPTTGAVIASLNLANANTWTGIQTFSNRTIFGASTTARSAINMIAGTAPTAPNIGDIWFDGSYVNLYSSGATVIRSNLGSTVSNTLGGIVLKDTTPATSAQTQYSPGVLFSGQAWSSQSGTGSETVQAMIGLQPVNGTTPANTGGNFVLSFNINGIWASPFSFSSAATNWTFGAAGLTINPVGGAGISLTSLSASAGHFNYPTPSFTFEQVGALTTAGFGTTFINGSGASTNTSGNVNQYQFVQSFSPTSGSGTFNLLSLQPTINQTGGASGTTVALSISPILTAASNFYAIQVLGGNSVFAAATTAGASIRIPTGSAPTTPVEGDMWKTGTHLFIYLNGATVQIV